MVTREFPSKSLALALLAAAQFMIILDASIVNVALPSIQDELKFSPAGLGWVVTSYALMFGGFLLLGGRLADLLGRRRMFVAGMSLFGLASLVGGFSDSELQLVICRGAQGLGAAMVSPAALSTITTMFSEGAERNRALGVWGAAAGAGGAFGVVLGGVLTQLLGWEWILFINVPVALAAVVLAPRLLIESRDPDHGSHDVLGAVAVTASLITLVYALVNANHAGWLSQQTLLLFALSTTLMAAFVFIEKRISSPLIEFSILRLRTLRAGNIIVFAYAANTLSMYYVMSLYTQQVLGYSALQTGLLFLPSALAAIPAAAVASKGSTRFGVKNTLIFGTFATFAGMAWMTQISADGSFLADVFGPSMFTGVGVGTVYVVVNIAALAGTDESNAGLGSGLINTSKEIGGALGLAILISVATHSTGNSLADGAPRSTAISDGLATGVMVTTAFALAAMILSILLISSKESQEMAQAAQRGAAGAGVAPSAAG
jgi:EmrB/QacA subfamily drug resistance transporter